MKRIFFFFALSLVIQMNCYSQKQKVIFDCDLAGDIDDAFALGLLISSPELQIMGIVMDHGLTKDRAKVACKMLYETGMEQIPVFVGRETVNRVGTDTAGDYSNQFYWAAGFDKVKPQAKSASDFIIETLTKYPGEVILFTVGPVPNMADIIKREPDILKKAKKVVSMFGSFYKDYSGNVVPCQEWNVVADIKSSQTFVESGANFMFAGLDITSQVKLNAEKRNLLFGRRSPLTDALCGLYTLWGYQWSDAPATPTLFDPVAIGMVIWPDLFTTKAVHTFVDDKGYTRIDENKKPNCEIGISINYDEFMNRYLKRLMFQNLSRN
jgi:purine nucleosidase